MFKKLNNFFFLIKHPTHPTAKFTLKIQHTITVSQSSSIPLTIPPQMKNYQ